MFDLDQVSTKYLYNKEDLTEGKYIDDNSLYIYQLLRKGAFRGKDASTDFFYYKPFEWSAFDFVAFLVGISKEYGFEVSNIDTNMSAITEEYEVSYFDENGIPKPHFSDTVANIIKNYKGKEKNIVLPKIYEGSYKWFLDCQEQNNTSETTQLFNAFTQGTASLQDIERAIIYADRILPIHEKSDTERYMTKEMFGKIVDWTTFSITMTEDQRKKLGADIDKYMLDFMNDNLIRNTNRKRVRGNTVSQSRNVFIYKKHDTLFREYLQKMYEDFGDTFTIENKFEDRFPNGDYISSEDIRSRFSERTFLFLHTLFSYEKRGLIEIITIGNNWDYHEDHFLTYQSKIKVSPPFFDEDKLKKLFFDADKHRLYVQGKEIKLLKFKDEYHTLNVIFSNQSELSKEWFFSEIKEKVDFASKADDKKYYNAIYQLKLKLAKVGINDFFITTKQSVKINEKYLS